MISINRQNQNHLQIKLSLKCLKMELELIYINPDCDDCGILDPYEYITNFETLNETNLPSHKTFYLKLIYLT